jgi:hypothetical protein
VRGRPYARIWNAQLIRYAGYVTRRPSRSAIYATCCAGRDVPADWSWIVPPISDGTTPVFHRYYPEADLRPGFYIDAAARDLGRFGEIGGGVTSAGDVCPVDQSQMAMASASEPTPVEVVPVTGSTMRRTRCSRLDSWFKSHVEAPLPSG